MGRNGVEIALHGQEGKKRVKKKKEKKKRKNKWMKTPPISQRASLSLRRFYYYVRIPRGGADVW